MKIKIYQIDMERDEHRIAMMGYEDTLARMNGDAIDSSLYDLVFDGEVEAKDLEAVYAKFNLDHPAGYTGRSMSVSDVVQVVESPTGKEGFYFCDSIGFKEIPFQPELTKSALPRTIDVVLVEPEKPARAAKITATLEGMQAAVGGTIEHLYPFEEQVSIVCNQEGKLIGLPLNRAVYAYDEQQVDMTYSELAAQFRAQERSGTGRHMLGYIVFTEDSFTEPYTEEQRTYVVSSDNKAYRPKMGGYSIYASSLDGKDRMVRLEQYMAAEHGGGDGWKVERCYTKLQTREMIEIMAGTFFICDCSGESFGSLSEEQLKKYTEMFKQPERFLRVNGEIFAIPYTPKKEKER
jgi:hypothetical protein